MSNHGGHADHSSQALIDQLARDLKPVSVKSLHYLAVQYFLTLLGVGLVCFGVVGWIFGVWIGVTQSEFVLSLLIFTLGIAAGCFLLAEYSRPGITLSRRARTLFFTVLGAATLMEIIRFGMQVGLPTWGPPIEGGWACLISALAMGGIGASVLVFELRREAPVRLRGAALFVLLTAGAMGALVMQVHCPNENPIHQILWHILLPLGVLALSAKALSHRVLNW